MSKQSTLSFGNSNSTQLFEQTLHHDGGTKWWACFVNGNQYTVKYGAFGKHTSEKTTDYPSHEVALKQATKTIKAKIGKGYAKVEAGADAPAASSSTSTKRAASSAAASKPAKRSKTTTTAATGDKPFVGFTFCCSGTLSWGKRLEFEEILLKNGARACKNSCTGDVTHLVIKDPTNPGTGTKVVLAQKNDKCTIVSEQWVLDRWDENAVHVSSSSSSSSSSKAGAAPDSDMFPMSAVMLANKYKPGTKHDKKVSILLMLLCAEPLFNRTHVHPFSFLSPTQVIGWSMSEKLDGLRAVWTGTKMFSRAKNLFQVPAAFLAEFPTDLVLDGELFCGKQNFDVATSLVRKGDTTYQQWVDGNVVYNVFDAPLLGGTFAERMVLLQGRLANKKHLKLCEQTTLKSIAHMQEYMKVITDDEGEGIMLRNPECPCTCVFVPTTYPLPLDATDSFFLFFLFFCGISVESHYCRRK